MRFQAGQGGGKAPASCRPPLGQRRGLRLPWALDSEGSPESLGWWQVLVFAPTVPWEGGETVSEAPVLL